MRTQVIQGGCRDNYTFEKLVMKGGHYIVYCINQYVLYTSELRRFKKIKRNVGLKGTQA
jgi:hypothetical protein